MNNTSLRKRLLFAAAGGLVGFFVLLIANAIVLMVALSHVSIVCCSGPYIFSLWENLIVFGFVPILIIFGISIPARLLNGTWWYGLLAGMISVGVIVIIQIFSNSNYSPFNNRETLQFISPVCIMALISTVLRKDRFFWGKLAICILAISLLGLKFVIPGNEFEVGSISLKVGFVISVVAWTLLPLVTVLFTMPNQRS